MKRTKGRGALNKYYVKPPNYEILGQDKTAKTTTYVKESGGVRTYLIFEADGTIRVRKVNVEPLPSSPEGPGK